MRKPAKRSRNSLKKDVLHTLLRKKLGLTQEKLASILSISRTYLALAESGKRTLHSASNTLLTKMFLQFHELETGKQASYRSLETRLLLNDEYKRILPEMKKLEQDCRYKIKELKKSMVEMKERARDTEHAIIVLTTAIDQLQENVEAGRQTKQEERRVTGLNLLKQQAYDKLLSCWEPEQAKLHGKIEAIAGEARALRRYRTQVIREHVPFKDQKKKTK